MKTKKGDAYLLLLPCALVAVFIGSVLYPLVIRENNLTTLQEHTLYAALFPTMMTSISTFVHFLKIRESGEETKGLIGKTIVVELMTAAAAIAAICATVSSINLWTGMELKVYALLLSGLFAGIFSILFLLAVSHLITKAMRFMKLENRIWQPFHIALINIPITAVICVIVLRLLKS